MTRDLPSLVEAKAAARRLRAEAGDVIAHGQALDLVARRHGFRDWNGLAAAVGSGPPRAWAVGGRVAGRYLGHPFTARVVAVEPIRTGWWRIALHFDEPMDVVASEHFSNLRSRITAVVGPAGASRERTSDGRPHLVVEI